MSPDEKNKSIDEKIRSLVEEYGEKERREKGLREREKLKSGRKQINSIWFRRAFILISAAFVLYLYILDPFFINPRTPEILWFSGSAGEADNTLQECIGTFWSIRREINVYYADNRRFPENLEDILGSGRLKDFPRCRQSGRRYVVDKEEGRSIVSCPDPDTHGVKKVWMDLRQGPPRVERR